jgi:hypothetical protein
VPRNGTQRSLGVVVVAASLAACAPHSTRDSTPSGPSPFVADWVRQQIAGFEAGENTRVDGKVLFNGTSLYLIHSPCCDLFNYLYTVEGKVFCAPSGGFAGGGDGRCPPGIGPVSRRVDR